MISVVVPKGDTVVNATNKSRARTVQVGPVVATVDASGTVTPWIGYSAT